MALYPEIYLLFLQFLFEIRFSIQREHVMNFHSSIRRLLFLSHQICPAVQSDNQKGRWYRRIIDNVSFDSGSLRMLQMVFNMTEILLVSTFPVPLHANMKFSMCIDPILVLVRRLREISREAKNIISSNERTKKKQISI